VHAPLRIGCGVHHGFCLMEGARSAPLSDRRAARYSAERWGCLRCLVVASSVNLFTSGRVREATVLDRDPAAFGLRAAALARKNFSIRASSAGSSSASIPAVFSFSKRTGCQGGLGGVAPRPSLARLAYVEEFKKIDAAGVGRVTMEQSVAYYSGLFAQLDKNRDGFLDANEIEAMLPALDAKSGKELISKFDRNSDGKLSQAEFLVISNWLFQLSHSPTQITLKDVQGF
jgi:EF hand domain-containing protein